MRKTSLCLLVLLVASPPLAAAGARQRPLPIDDLESHSIDAWPKHILSLGTLYAPAPLLVFVTDEGETVHRKLLDQAGGQISLDWRFTRRLFFGGRLTVLGNTEGSLVEGGVRFGGLWLITDSLAFQGRLAGGMSYWSADLGMPVKYLGPQIGLIFGIRWLARPWFGLYADVGGSVSLWEQLEGPGDSSGWLRNEVEMLRLRIEAGVLFGF